MRFNVMAGYSRPKDGVLSHAYVPAIHVFDLGNAAKTWIPGIKPGMTNERRHHILRSFPRRPPYSPLIPAKAGIQGPN